MRQQPPATGESDRAALKLLLYVLANLFATVVLILLALDPTRPLVPIFVLLTLAVVFILAACFLPQRPRGVRTTREDHWAGNGDVP
jgi:hypothetical protein